MAAPDPKDLPKYRKDLEDIAKYTEEAFRTVADNVSQTFKDALAQGQSVSKSFGNDIKNNMNSLARIATDNIANQEKLKKGLLTQQSIQKQIETREAKILAIQNSIEASKLAGIKISKQLLEDLERSKDLNEIYIGQLKQQQKLVKDTEDSVNKQLGIFPKLLGGLDAAMKKLGLPNFGFDDALKKTQAMGQAAKANGEEFNATKAYIGNIKDNLKESFSSANLLQTAFVIAAKTFLDLDDSIGTTAKQLGVSYNTAAGLSQEFNNIANSTGNIFVTTKGINESFNQINAALGTNGKINSEILVTQTELVKQAGYSVEAATAISKLSLATGKPAKEITTQFLGQAKALNLVNGTAINEKQLLEEVSKTSKAILITFADQPGALAAAAYEVKKLGLSLDQIKGIQDSLLNVESSISNEFEAEVLTGKQLNLERARYYALTNNITGLAKELGNQGITQAKFAGMNVIQQEAVAKAMGMSRDQMAEMLMNQTAINKITGVEGATAKERYNNAVKKYGVEKANAMLGDETLANQLQSASMQDRFNASIEKLKDLFVGLIEPLMPVLDMFTNILGVVGMISQAFQTIFNFFGGIGESISKMMGPLGTVGKLIKDLAYAGIIWAAYSAYASLATIPVAGVALGAVAAAGITAAGFGLLGSIKDGVIDPKKGPIVSGEFGSVQLHPNDQIVAGTNLMPNGGASRSSSGVDYERLGAHIANAVSKVQVQTNLDGVAVSRGLQAPMGQTTRKI